MKQLLIILLLIYSNTVLADNLSTFTNQFKSNDHVYDYAGVFKDNVNDYNWIVNQMDTLNRFSSVDYYFCIIDSLAGFEIKEVAKEICSSWKHGVLVDRSALMLIAVENRKVYLYTTADLREDFSDDEVQTILDTHTIPFLTQDNYHDAIYKGFAEMKSELWLADILNIYFYLF